MAVSFGYQQSAPAVSKSDSRMFTLHKAFSSDLLLRASNSLSKYLHNRTKLIFPPHLHLITAMFFGEPYPMAYCFEGCVLFL